MAAVSSRSHRAAGTGCRLIALVAALFVGIVAAPVAGQQLALLSLPSQVKEPAMVDLPGGTFAMGSGEEAVEKPVHKVAVRPFALGKYPVTNGEWRQCLDSRVCTMSPTGGDDEPVRNVSWDDAQQYIAWLAKATNRNYRLPTEAEFEYAERGGTATRFWWGDMLKDGVADCKGCGGAYDTKAPQKVDAFQPNALGLYGMAGGVDEWVADCWHKNYAGAPADGSAWREEKCDKHVLRGGSWKSTPKQVRAASRDQYDTSVRYLTHGFRLARSLE